MLTAIALAILSLHAPLLSPFVAGQESSEQIVAPPVASDREPIRGYLVGDEKIWR
jgi:hypothetical protein